MSQALKEWAMNKEKQMYFETKLHDIEFNVDYSVDSEGDYDKFDISIGDDKQIVNDVLTKEVIDELESACWTDYISFSNEHNNELRLNSYLASQGY